MTNLDMNEFFIRYSSQTICGIKPASMFTIPAENFSERIFGEWKKIVRQQNLLIFDFNISEKTKMIFVCDLNWIKKILKDYFVRTYLKNKNYSCVTDAEKTLEELFSRLKENEIFPHEVGVFLGYPLEDVIKFEENQGKFCKYCGYWKSYCNTEEARKCCLRYRLCSQMCKQWFDEGYSISQIIKKYKEAVDEAA